jgi:16S rRNA (uracil1498-N3)-methyltransferase
LTRVYVDEPLAAGTSCLISGSAANHIARVLRSREGDALTLFDGRGGEYGARIAGFRKDLVQVEVLEHRDVERESALDLTLAQGISRGERMDWVMQKATELGVRRIVPVLTERSVVKLDDRQSEKKLQHWRGIVIAACEQCGRNRIPEVAAPLSFYEAIRTGDGGGAATSRAGSDAAAAGAAPSSIGHTTAAPSVARLLLSPQASLRARDLPCPSSVVLLIGPEGGLADNEEELAIKAGFKPVQLGPRILRTETAAIAALAALQHDFGDL